MLRGRSCRDFERSLSYSLYLLNDGRIGSRAEREYIQSERAKIQYERLSGAIKTFKYNEATFDEEDSFDEIKGKNIRDDSDGEVKEEIIEEQPGILRGL